jgi:hypothetical protein
MDGQLLSRGTVLVDAVECLISNVAVRPSAVDSSGGASVTVMSSAGPSHLAACLFDSVKRVRLCFDRILLSMVRRPACAPLFALPPCTNRCRDCVCEKRRVTQLGVEPVASDARTPCYLLLFGARRRVELLWVCARP